MKTTIKKPKKLASVDSITGMWNGHVFFKVAYLGEIQARLHIGLIASDRIKSGELAENVISEVIKEHLGYTVSSIVGVKSDRKMKEALDPFSK